MRQLIFAALATGTFMLFAACSSDGSGSTAQVCIPGEFIICACGSQDGTSECRDDGSGFEGCVCRGNTNPPADAGTDSGVSDTSSSIEDAEDVSEEPDSGAGDDVISDVGRDTADEDVQAELDSGTDVSADGDAEIDVEADTGTGAVALGGPCERAADCASGICIETGASGFVEAICVQPCCHEGIDCPIGFTCQSPPGSVSRFCLPPRIFGPAATFDRDTGAPCTSASQCRSGICDLSAGFCRGTCCTPSECDATVCRWSNVGSGNRTYCDPAGLLAFGRTGAPCTSEFDCQSGVCIPYGPGDARCADLCCTSRECAAGTVCGLVSGPGPSYARACVDATVGDKLEGAECTADEECRSFHCVEGACRTLCCDQTDCGVDRFCRPRATSDGVLAPFCVPSDG